MNHHTNIHLVEEYGDKIQLDYGKEFGYFAHRINDEQLFQFCENINVNTFSIIKGYHLSIEFYDNGARTSQIFLKNYKKNICAPIQLLDHTIYIDATSTEWSKIEKTYFEIILKEWRKFLARNIPEYKTHFNNTIILSQQDFRYTIK